MANVKQTTDPRGLTLIEGRKKGGAGRTPVEDKDSLRSTQIARIVDAIGEGECEGLANGLKDVFLDGVPIQNSDGSLNFEGVTFAWTAGTQGQPAVPSMGGVENEIAVQVDVKKATPIIRTITDPDVDAVRVTIGVPQLTNQDMSTGDLHGSSFEWIIEVQSNGGGFVERYRDTVSGKCTTQYTKSVLVNIAGIAPHDIRLKRITDDSTVSTVVNGFGWQSYTEIIQRKLRYPHTCMSYLQVNAQQFARVPQRSWRWRGLRVKVPSNFDPITRAYTGTWDGTFKMAWTNNPAWCMYAMVTNKRWGLGSFVSEALQNKWALYKIGKYCDELVPNGFGGVEPRFTCNWVFSTREQAYKVLQDLAAVFRGMTWWAHSTVEYAQDAPQDAQMLYTAANVVDGTFTYQDTSEKTLHSVFICYWNDLSQQGKRIPEVYAPSDLIAKYGVREIQIQLIGCTSRSQAARMCRWMRYSEEMEGTAVSFRVGPDGQIAAPGKVFRISDPNEAGERLGGRVKLATTSAITLDAPVELKAGQTYTLTCLSFDPIDPMVVTTEERTVTTSAVASTAMLQVSPPFTAAPSVGTTWILSSAALQASTWRCLSVQPVSGRSNIEFEITGIAHNPSKFGYIENGLTLDEPAISRLASTVLPPSNLQLVETVYSDGVVNKSRLTVSWVPSAESLRHSVSYRTDTGWWQALPDTSAQSVDINPIQPGVYEVAVKSTNVLGNTSPSTQSTITIAGGLSGVRAVRLQASALVIKVATNGTEAPASVSISANIGGLAGTIVWTVSDGSVLTGTASTKTLSAAAMDSNSTSITASVTERGQTYSDTVTVLRLFDGATGQAGAAGADAITMSLGNEAHIAPADAGGVVASFAGAKTTARVYRGITDDTANWTISKADTHVSSTLLIGDNISEYGNLLPLRAWNFNGALDGWSAPNNGYGLLTAGAQSATLQAQMDSGSWHGLIEAGTNNVGGTFIGATVRTIRMRLSKPTLNAPWCGYLMYAVDGGHFWDWGYVSYASEPAWDADGWGVAQWDMALSSAPSDWSHGLIIALRFIVISGAAATSQTQLDWIAVGTIEPNVVSITAMSADTGYVDITAARAGFPSIVKRFTVTKSKTGATGAVGSQGATGASGQPGTAGATGAAGAPAVAAQMTLDAIALPADSAGNVSSYTGANSSMFITLGGVNDTANWAFSHVASSALTVTRSNETVTIAAMNAANDIGTIDVTATRSGYASITRRVYVSKAKAGAAGAQGSQGAAGAQGPTGAAGADGATAKLLVLSATSQVFQITKAGANNPAAITLSATGQNLVGSPTFTVTAGTATLTGTGTSRSLTFANMGTDSVTIQVIQDGQADSTTIVKLREGQDGVTGAAGAAGQTGAVGAAGADAITMVISNEAHTVPADSAGVVASFSGATSTAKVYRGITDDTANWTISKADSSLTSTLASDTVSVTAMSADTGFVDITAARAGFPSIVKRFTVTKSKTGTTGATGAAGSQGATGAAGQRGSVTRAYTTTVTSWSDSEALAALSSAGYSGAMNLDIVTLVNSSANWSEARFYANGSWLQMQAWITGNLMVDGTVATSKLVVNGGVGSSLWPDPNCVDPSMWAVASWGTLPLFRSTATGNTGDRVMASPASTRSANGFPMQPVTQGGTYKISALVRTLPNTNGTFYLRYVYSGTPKGTQTYVLGTVEGVAVPQQWTEYSWEFTPPAGARYVSPTVVLNFGGTAGDMECQSIRIREMLDSSMVVQGGLSADRISTPKLSALSSILGSVEIDASGYLRGGQTAYSTGNGFWFGYSGGAYKASMKSPAGNGFTFDGTDMVLKGKFTADAIDAVDTLNIKGQSITVPLYATMSLENTNYSGPYSKTLTLPSVNLYGSLQVIHLYVKFYVDTGGAVPSSTTFSLTRGGTTVFSKTFPAYNNAESPYIDFLIDEFFSDNPGTGNVQYTISMSHVGTYGVGVARIVISGARR